MPTAYVGPGWENPERKKILEGSLADVYIRDGFTVACLVEVSFIDRQRRRGQGDLVIFSPLDQMTPIKDAVDFEQAEQFIEQQRELHPEWPTVPEPPKVLVPRFKGMDTARDAVREIVGVLESRDIQLHGYTRYHTAVLLFAHCQRMFIDQKSVDYAQEIAEVRSALIKGV